MIKFNTELARALVNSSVGSAIVRTGRVEPMSPVAGVPMPATPHAVWLALRNATA